MLPFSNRSAWLLISSFRQNFSSATVSSGFEQPIRPYVQEDGVDEANDSIQSPHFPNLYLVIQAGMVHRSGNRFGVPAPPLKIDTRKESSLPGKCWIASSTNTLTTNCLA
jgi:hypothetical protein